MLYILLAIIWIIGVCFLGECISIFFNEETVIEEDNGEYHDLYNEIPF